MTASSNRSMVLNTRERLVSTDHNRLQQFLGTDLAEIARFALMTTTGEETNSNGIGTPSSTTGTPLRAIIVNGFLVTPEVAGTNLTISAGVAWAVFPDVVPSTDDSAAKLVIDDGLLAGTLAFSANAGPGVRVDIVEMQPVLVTTETESRDIYNPATGLFAPVSVPKVKQLQAAFRLRVGVQGAGYPGNALGWVPLCVVVTPAGAADWDACDFFDVRPLASDLSRPGFRSNNFLSDLDQQLMSAGKIDASTDARVRGRATGVYNGFRAGGNDAHRGGFNLSTGALADAEPTFIADITVAIKVWYLYAAFPEGLPRWCRYSPASSGSRRPGGFRGIPTASVIPPSNAAGFVTAITPPAYTGLIATTGGVCVFAGGADSTATPKVIAASSDGAWIHTQGGTIFAPTATTATTTEYDFTDILGIYPVNAKAVRIFLALNFAATGASAGLEFLSLNVRVASDVTAPGWSAVDAVRIDSRNVPIYNAAANTFSASWVFECPLWSRYPDTLAANVRKIQILHASITGIAAPTSTGFAILGWKI